jgi:hypothetical protein
VRHGGRQGFAPLLRHGAGVLAGLGRRRRADARGRPAGGRSGRLHGGRHRRGARRLPRDGRAGAGAGRARGRGHRGDLRGPGRRDRDVDVPGRPRCDAAGDPGAGVGEPAGLRLAARGPRGRGADELLPPRRRSLRRPAGPARPRRRRGGTRLRPGRPSGARAVDVLPALRARAGPRRARRRVRALVRGEQPGQLQLRVRPGRVPHRDHRPAPRRGVRRPADARRGAHVRPDRGDGLPPRTGRPAGAAAGRAAGRSEPVAGHAVVGRRGGSGTWWSARSTPAERFSPRRRHGPPDRVSKVHDGSFEWRVELRNTVY